MIPIDEQPYPLPDGWQWCRLGDVCKFIGGGTPSKDISSYWCGDIPWASVKDIKGDYLFDTVDRITKAGLKNSSANLCEKDDLILVTRIEPGKSIVAKIVSAVNQDLKIVKSSLPAKFLHYFFNTVQQEIESMSSGSTVKGITLRKLKNFLIPLPPRDEQQRIVALLDELFSKLDEAKALAQSVVDGSELRRAAILHKAFTGELSRLWRDEHDTTLDSWQKKFLSELLLPMQTKRPTGETFRYIDIDSIDNKRQTIRTPKIIRTVEAPSRASRAVESGNVLFSMVRPYLKNVAFIDENLKDCIASTGFFVCRCKEGLSPKFLYQFLCFDGTINYLMQFMRGDNSPSIRKDEFLGTSINLPPPEEQKEIVRLLDDLLGREQRTKDLALKTIERVELMKKSILARAFRGELGTN